MKQKLLLFILPMLFLTTLTYAQQVWDFGGEDLSGEGYTSMIIDNNREGDLYANGAIGSSGMASTGNTIGDFALDGKVSWVQKPASADRLRGTNTAMTIYDTNDGPAPTYDVAPTDIGRLYANGVGNASQRHLKLTLSAGEKFTVIVASESTSGSIAATFNIMDPSLSTTVYTEALTTAFALHIDADVTGVGDYLIWDSTSKMSIYRVYDSNFTDSNIANRVLAVDDISKGTAVNVYAAKDRIYVSNVKTNTEVNIYSITGALVKTLKTNTDTDFNFKSGLWIATVKTSEGQKAVKLLTY